MATLAVVITLLAALGVAVPPTPAAAASPTVHLSDGTVVQGQRIRISGRRYPARVRVAIYVTGAARKAVFTRTDRHGRFQVTLTVPDVKLGRHRVVVARVRQSTRVIQSSAAGVRIVAKTGIKVRSRPTRAATPVPTGSPSATPVVGSTSDPGSSTNPSLTPSPAPSASPRPTPAPSATPSPAPSTSPRPSPAPSATPVPAGTVRWGLIGDDGTHQAVERAAGITTKVFSLSWRKYMTGPGLVDPAYVERKRAELAAIRSAGFDVILSLGYHDVPSWVLGLPDATYVNQWGDVYAGAAGAIDLGEANLVWNPVLRSHLDAYIGRVFADLGTDFAAVRVGGGRYGELTYPPASVLGHTNNYWAFDANAARTNPVPGWRPGDPSPAGEAGRFLDWYLGALADYQGWQVKAVRARYAGRIMVLYPSWGIRPGQAALAVADNLSGATSAEVNGEIQRGFDFARQVAAVDDRRVVVTTTWLDADGSRDAGSDQRYWSPVKYLSALAANHPLHLAVYGENTGQGTVDDLRFTADQAARYGLEGFAWYRESELFSGGWATIADYAALVAGN